MNLKGYLFMEGPFVDERLTGMCVYCGGQPNTRDHVPSRTLLEEPFPPHMPVVGACANCNAGFSLRQKGQGLLPSDICAPAGDHLWYGELRGRKELGDD